MSQQETNQLTVNRIVNQIISLELTEEHNRYDLLHLLQDCFIKHNISPNGLITAINCLKDDFEIIRGYGIPIEFIIDMIGVLSDSGFDNRRAGEATRQIIRRTLFVQLTDIDLQPNGITLEKFIGIINKKIDNITIKEYYKYLNNLVGVRSVAALVAILDSSYYYNTIIKDNKVYTMQGKIADNCTFEIELETEQLK